ncbi:MAG: periplasmic heavy metal sensor [Gemmatimonadetes bacterium]|uniref:Periplasmic heavy metal sensor n=1 Tax=Candidatus Kutchimonas denitrificans TaxID=3056748 RepID=A0AAE4Z974_9BACT|nr:periplasmic heavy metal sensor [Gemmatimonadota bacterium]NIR76149.1 periplasmic heavy metal sensor [Candidatus Kutchimonas denitrificans]NIS00528.1 periplasmic heavy metal sensor [Gemmatimonadota bacterium]NIT66186.1 periplasmic heavy metal sensor [Gemmatimonadota bacterium]NIU54264.1 periplasmic heavy metal sensor [Gemmatimonadota bacterium]
MRTLLFVACCWLVVGVGVVDAQHEQHRSPYADEAASEIASLSAKEVEGLRNGDGMGLARAAELNSYPGPRHVIDLADELSLSAEQRARVTEIFDAMHEAAVRLGAEIIEAEGTMSRRFEHRHIDRAALEELTEKLGALYGDLRNVHLEAHLAVAEVLDPEQIAEYDRLRGYADRREEMEDGEG